MSVRCPPDWVVAAERSSTGWRAPVSTVWQILPLGPTGPDGSPYWVLSDSAGNAALIDAEEQAPLDSGEFQAFVDSSHDWLDDFAAFEVLSSLHSGAPWWAWQAEYRDRQPATMEQLRRDQASALRAVSERQFTFAWQWHRLHEYAKSRGVYLFGDVPFYVAPDSVEVWAHRDQFQLDATGRPTAVAGVPPDYFSQTGQLWGNPLYAWDAMRDDGFRFWRSRIQRQLQRVDLLRIDHFRALAAHWAVPRGCARCPQRQLAALVWTRASASAQGQAGHTAAGRRGPGCDHPGCGSPARGLWPGRHARHAVRLRWVRRQFAPAAHVRTGQRGVHGYP